MACLCRGAARYSATTGEGDDRIRALDPNRAVQSEAVALVTMPSCAPSATRVGLVVVVAGLVPVAAGAPALAAADEAAGIDFFEKRVRPVLVEHCLSCHGPAKQRSGLRLDRPGDILKGGDRGPAVVGHSPKDSPLVQAIRYDDADLSMPPKGKLPERAVADLNAWVEMGAPMPRAADPAPAVAVAEFDLARRRQHWAYQPIRAVEPPALADPWAAHSPIDRFLLASLRKAGLKPAPAADRRTLIRRVTFDLIGLPPTPDEVEAFVADRSPDAFAKVVDRLLASPHYGERWARHWLDLVRYTETLGFEFDFDLYNAWRYRDYVIRAFNADLPYDQFLVEHIAGDLLDHPRVVAERDAPAWNESILGTAFYTMGEGRQTPLDIRQEQVDRIDNQIDVLGKTFLGQTIACARCHDHKFDAISTRDYYALAGYFKSSRFQQGFLDPPDRSAQTARQTTELRGQLRTAAVAQLGPAWRAQAGDVSRYLLAARRALMTGATCSESIAREAGLDGGRLERWVDALKDSAAGMDQPFHAWAALAAADTAAAPVFQQRGTALLRSLRAQPDRTGSGELFDDFRRPAFDGWTATGDAFGPGPARRGDLLPGSDPDGGWRFRLAEVGAVSALVSPRLQGELRSRSFTIGRRYVHVRLSGRRARLNLVIDGYTLIMNPIYGGLKIEPKSERPAWYTMDVGLWKGHRAFLELTDSTIPPYGLNPPAWTGKVPETAPDATLGLHEVRFSDEATPPATAASPSDQQALIRGRAGGPEALATTYQQLLLAEIDRWGSSADGDIELLSFLLDRRLLDSGGVEGQGSLAALLARVRAIEAAGAHPARAPVVADGSGEDEQLLLRGNPETPGPPVPRGPPQVMAAGFQLPDTGSVGSGRLAFARHLVRGDNPLVARVMVNRIWQHHFGAGIVRTPDDFGRMGQPPSHPELLDWLASQFMAAGWSIKKMHRLMLLTSAYQMQSQAPAAAARVDPDNRLLHHMPVQRLDAEQIRDAMLAVSGRLDRTMYGPSVLPFVTEHMEGRGRPESGPLDGGGRRSIYISARRNFPVPMLVAFDLPSPASTLGRRGTSTVPAQALTLMNDPFVVQQARRWAEGVLQAGGDPGQRIERLWRQAFSRPPLPLELRQAQAFLARQGGQYRGGGDDVRAWADLCHVLFNLKEFIFLP